MTTLKFIAKSHRYFLDGKPIPGVTTLLNKGLPKPALPRWAAKSAAEYVADNLDALRSLPDRESIISVVKQSPWSARDRAAVRGTDVHELAEQIIHGHEVEVPEHLDGYVDGYVTFLDKWRIEPLVVERPLANRRWWYAGTSDAVVRLPDGRIWLMDWKTAKGVYGDNALQVAAYANAEFYVDGHGDEQPMPDIDGLAVVHITPEGTDVYQVADPEAAWKQFQHVAWVARQEDAIKAHIADPVEPPAQEASA